MNLSVSSVKSFYCKNALLIAATKAAREVAKIERAEVDSYCNPLLAKAGLTYDDERLKNYGEPILDRKHTYLSNDEEAVAAYHAACDEAHKANGYELEPGYCPALIAESEVIDWERKLLKAAAGAYGVEFDKIYNLELRAKALDLFLNPPMA